jgi:hypothetical protein
VKDKVHIHRCRSGKSERFLGRVLAVLLAVFATSATAAIPEPDLVWYGKVLTSSGGATVRQHLHQRNQPDYAKLTPKKMFFYGCNTEKSGFVRVLSELQPKSDIVGAGARIAQGIEWDITPRGTRVNFRVSEDRDHNIIYRGGKETKNVRQVSTHDLQNAGLPRP